MTGSRIFREINILLFKISSFLNFLFCKRIYIRLFSQESYDYLKLNNINSIRNLIKSVLRFLFEYGEFIFVVEVWILLLYKCLLIPQLALELFIRNSWILFGVEIFTATGLKNKFTVYPPPTFRAVFVFLLFWVMTIRSTTHYFNKF